ncbi:hypothetical protein L3X38_042650 [Prunus dulcis]|uniref:Uncharacterized protein n=1 Tax=Prunus dulcis TaxID=3755 RepID=A0AAD4UWP5_PRUDU|nr:hypothetical protein L3X38_042650 [Prunus dulcis]
MSGFKFQEEFIVDWDELLQDSCCFEEDMELLNLLLGILHCLNMLLIFRLSALSIELKILRAQPFFGKSNFLMLDHVIHDLKNGVGIIEITSVEKIKIAVILSQKEACVWWEYCGQVQG